MNIPNGPRTIVDEWAIKNNLPLDRVGDFIGGINPRNNPLQEERLMEYLSQVLEEISGPQPMLFFFKGFEEEESSHQFKDHLNPPFLKKECFLRGKTMKGV